jgi:hypothetical protein
MIENMGECPVETITTVGATMSRGNDSLLGMFGDGSMYGIIQCLREDIEIVICCGTNRLYFTTIPIELNDGIDKKTMDTAYWSSRPIPPGLEERKKTKKRMNAMGVASGFGEMGWTTEMALREFTANAIDHSVKRGLKPTDVIFSEKDEVRAAAGRTRVFIQRTEDTDDFFLKREAIFLQLNEDGYDPDIHIMPKLEKGEAHVYVGGVRVSKFQGVESMFDYNIPNSQAAGVLDESRKLGVYAATTIISKLFAKHATPEQIAAVMHAKDEGHQVWESRLDGWYMKREIDSTDQDSKDRWKEGFELFIGPAGVACTDTTRKKALEKKGHNARIVNSDMMELANLAGVPTETDVLDRSESEGRTQVPVSKEIKQAYLCVWNQLEVLSLVKGKEVAALRAFEGPMDGCALTSGFYDPKTKQVWISNSLGGSMLIQVIMEELAHYITGSTDNSRDFQDYLLLVMSKLLKEPVKEIDDALHYSGEIDATPALSPA